MIAAQMAVPRPPFPANVDAITGSASSVITARMDGDTRAKNSTMNASAGTIVFHSEYLSVAEEYGDTAKMTKRRCTRTRNNVGRLTRKNVMARESRY
jgi:hypothetical protein